MIISFWLTSGKAAACTNFFSRIVIFSLFFAEINSFSTFMSANMADNSSFCVASNRSDLLNKIIIFFPSQCGRMSAFNSSNRLWASVESIIHKMTYAWSIFWKVRSIPRFSIVSFVWRIPAVSINRNVTPCKLIVSSITSRVVPWISLTMAFSSFSNAFSKVDFPAFVSPIIATGMPFLIAFPTLKE